MRFRYIFRLFFKCILCVLFICICLQIRFHDRIHREHRNSTSVQVKLHLNNSILINKTNCIIAKPSSTTLDYLNTYWQYFRSSDGIFYLYHAYYDIRRATQTHPTIRILAMINRLSPINLSCQVWFHNSSVSIQTKASYRHIWNKNWENNRNFIFQPYLIDCPLERRIFMQQSLHPKYVSIFENKCAKLRNLLRIDDNYFYHIKHGKKSSFAVCVKGLDFPTEDKSLPLIEWIELLKLLGVSRISFYQYEIHPNISTVLNFYQKEHLVSLETISLPGPSSNLHSLRRTIFQEKKNVRRQHEVIPYNDCFYRNMYQYNYIVLLDIDEIILPLHGGTWLTMFQKMQQRFNRNQTYTAFSARHVYFFHQNVYQMSRKLNLSSRRIFNLIPNYFHMLKQIERSTIYTKSGAFVKTFFDSEQVITLHNHHPISCFGPCQLYEMNRSFVHLQHYRNDCVDELRKTCIIYRNSITQDITIWKYRYSLINRTTYVARKLLLIF